MSFSPRNMDAFVRKLRRLGRARVSLHRKAQLSVGRVPVRRNRRKILARNATLLARKIFEKHCFTCCTTPFVATSTAIGVVGLKHVGALGGLSGAASALYWYDPVETCHFHDPRFLVDFCACVQCASPSWFGASSGGVNAACGRRWPPSSVSGRTSGASPTEDRPRGNVCATSTCTSARSEHWPRCNELRWSRDGRCRTCANFSKHFTCCTIPVRLIRVSRYHQLPSCSPHVSPFSRMHSWILYHKHAIRCRSKRARVGSRPLENHRIHPQVE